MRQLHTAILSLLIVVSGVGCSGPTPSPQGASGLTTIKVGIMPIPDCATIVVAQQRGYFTAEGLAVETEIVQGGGIAMPKLQSGALDFSIMNYVAAIQKEAAAPGVVKLVSDAYQAAPGAFMLMVPKTSPIKSVGDLKGKRISALTLNSVGTLTLESKLRVEGLKKTDVIISERAVTDMINALEDKRIDAAWMTEPFINAYAKQGGLKIADMMEGETDKLPIAGWATSGTFAKNNPGVVVGFQRAMLRAQIDVAKNPALAPSILPTYTKIDAETATTIALGTFPIGLAPSRIERVVDLMVEYGYIKQGAVTTGGLLIPEPPLPAASTLPPPPTARHTPHEPELEPAS